jgi:DNA-binding GntR family transcriptional regulator
MLDNFDAPTYQDEAYQRLSQWLTLGRFVPGQRLKIRQVAAELGLGIMPVRAALQRLAAEHALINVPNKGVTVPKLSQAEFDDVLQMRLMLEGEAAERGAYRLSDEQCAQLEALSSEMAAAVAAQDSKRYLDANEAFHRLLYGASGSPLLLQLIETVWLKIGPLSNGLFDDASSIPHLNDAHEKLLAGIRQKNPKAVRHALEEDLYYAGSFLRRLCS